MSGYRYLSSCSFPLRPCRRQGISPTIVPSPHEEALYCHNVRQQPQPGLLHHSDRGSQYASAAYLALLHQHRMICSMGRRGNYWDNAVVERVFRSVRHEGLDATAKKWPAETVKATIIDYMGMFYHSHRVHTTLGYPSPNAFGAHVQGLPHNIGWT